jgi:dihydrofolate synthase/folylpolyglutamate synthase
MDRAVVSRDSTASHAREQYPAALEYLSNFVDLERRGMTAAPLGLARIRELLQVLGNPEHRYLSILIAGTKGKGSTAAMLERALRAAGHRTGLYTQPHLHTIRERIRVNGELIAPEEFATALSAVRRAVVDGAGGITATTAYEVTTAMALQHFAAAEVKVAVLEVGLGGRLDATNAVSADLSVITSISLDHMEVLGPTVAAIAAEKADIVKLGRPSVSAPQAPEAMAIIRRTARDRQAPLRVAMEDGARWIKCADRWHLETSRGTIRDVQPALRGAHQRVNAAVMATVADVLAQYGTLGIELNAVRTGVEQVIWPGRFEVVAQRPTIVLDGAHNVESAVRLREAIQDEYAGTRVVFVLGVAADKDVAGIVTELGRTASGPEGPDPAYGHPMIIATRAQHPRAADPALIVSLARTAGSPELTAPTVAEALAVARRTAAPDDLIVVTGSLYTVAEAREALGIAEPGDEPSFNPWATR